MEAQCKPWCLHRSYQHSSHYRTFLDVFTLVSEFCPLSDLCVTESPMPSHCCQHRSDEEEPSTRGSRSSTVCTGLSSDQVS